MPAVMSPEIDEVAAHEVDGGGTERADQAQRHEERAVVDGVLDPDVPHPAGPLGELVGLLVVGAEELDQQGA